MKYEWFIASRYLRSRRKQSFISIISVISVGGVALGIATVILVISVLDGFGQGLKDKFLANEAHVIVRSTEGHFSNYQEKIDQIEAIEGVVASSPVILGQLALQPKASEIIEDTIYVKGIDPQQEDRVTGFSEFVNGFTGFQNSLRLEEARQRVAGRETITGGIVLGYHVARRMGVVPGDIIRAISRMVADPVHPGSFLPHIRNFVIIGLYQSGIHTYDNAFGFIDLGIAQALYNKPNQVNMIEVRTVDADMASAVRHRIQTQIRFNEGFSAVPRTTTWMDSYAPLFNALKLEELVTVIIVAMIILVAAFNIASTLIMMVMEKTRDIGTLRALGAAKHEIRKIFVIQGSIIGALGALIGTVLGVVICWLLDFQVVRPSRWLALLILLPVGVQFFLAFQRTIPLNFNFKGLLALLWAGATGLFLYCLVQPIYLDNILGQDLSQVYQLNRLPVKINWLFVVIMNVLSFSICWLAALYPAWHASNLNPVEALRYE
ncbi:MAG: ABC transporter permease [Candidatus Poribacteria bacterium]|nr:ABC transporter permease [Candidatus Poribacteria bacterium]